MLLVRTRVPALYSDMRPMVNSIRTRVRCYWFGHASEVCFGHASDNIVSSVRTRVQCYWFGHASEVRIRTCVRCWVVFGHASDAVGSDMRPMFVFGHASGGKVE